jgi:hypothetical protein
MAQHDMQIANNTGIAVRGDINAALAALVTNNSGDTAPSPTYPFMWWADSNTGHLKQRNAANTAWIDHGDLSSALLRASDIASGGSGGLLRKDGDGASLTGVSSGNITYDNSTSGLTAANVKAAIDEVVGRPTTTVQATTSGTAKDFAIPAWATEITVNFMGISLNGSRPVIQIGDSGGVETSGYLGSIARGTSALVSTNLGASFELYNADSGATVFSGSVRLILGDSATFTWCAYGGLANLESNGLTWLRGHKSLSSALTTVRVTSVTGTNNFDAGKVSVTYR